MQRAHSCLLLPWSLDDIDSPDWQWKRYTSVSTDEHGTKGKKITNVRWRLEYMDWGAYADEEDEFNAGYFRGRIIQYHDY